MNGTNPHFQQGLELREQRRLKQAVAVFMKALEIEPSNGEIWFQLGMTYDNRAEENKAIPCYINAIKLGIEEANMVRARLYLASSYLKTGMPELAQLTLNEIVQAECDEAQLRRMQYKIDRAITRLKLQQQSEE